MVEAGLLQLVERYEFLLTCLVALASFYIALSMLTMPLIPLLLFWAPLLREWIQAG